MNKENFKLMVEDLVFTVLCGYEDNGISLDTQIKERYDEVVKARDEIIDFVKSDKYWYMFEDEDEDEFDYNEYNDDIDDMLRQIDVWIEHMKQHII